MYRAFEEVSDTRPLPSGFATGFNPDIPTAAEVEATKRKQEQEKKLAAEKSPEISFKEGIKQDEVELTREKKEVQQAAIQEIYETGKLEKNKPRVKQLESKIAQGIEDLAISEDLTKNGYGKQPRFMAGFNRKMAEFWAMPIGQRPPIREYMKTFESNPEEVLDLNIDAAEFVKNIGDQEYQKAVTNRAAGTKIDKETFVKSKFPNGQVDTLTMETFMSDPARKKTIDFNRRKTETETVNSLFGKGGKVKARVRTTNPDGTPNIIDQEFTNPEELANLVTNGEAYPVDSNGKPLQGFDGSFGLLAVEKRNNRIASNYLLNAAGITRKNETSTIIDEDEAGVRDGFGFGIRTRPEIVLAEGKETQAIQQFGLAEKLIKAGVPKADAERAQFENKTALLPSVVKNGESKLISLEGVNIPDASGQFVDTYVGQDGKPIALRDAKRTEMPKNVKIFSAEPITTNSSGHRVVIPEELKGDKIVTYLTERTGTNSRGKLKGEIAVNLVTENSAGELEPIVYRLKDWQDPVWIKFATVATPGVKQSEIRKNAKKMYDDLMAKNQYLPQIKEAVSIQEKEKAKKETPQKKVKPVNTPKPKAKVSL
jgi:hypothetical protein